MVGLLFNDLGGIFKVTIMLKVKIKKFTNQTRINFVTVREKPIPVAMIWSLFSFIGLVEYNTNFSTEAQVPSPRFSAVWSLPY